MPAGGWPLKDAKIAFLVKLGLEDVKPTDPLKGQTWKEIHEDANNYSLSRLYMDLTCECIFSNSFVT